MRQPHPNTHLVEAVIKALSEVDYPTTAQLIHDKFVNDYPQADIPSPRTIASIKKRMETPETPPSNLCTACMGYGYLYEQTKTYFGDGTESVFLNDRLRGYIEITCPICENSGINPSWKRPISGLMRTAPTPAQEVATEFINIPNNQGTQDYEEPLERTL